MSADRVLSHDLPKEGCNGSDLSQVSSGGVSGLPGIVFVKTIPPSSPVEGIATGKSDRATLNLT